MGIFNRNEIMINYESGMSLLKEGLVIKDSKITGCGNIAVSGLVDADIDIDGDVRINESGVVRGSVSCVNLTVEGTLNSGSVTASRNVSIVRGGSVTSDVMCSGLNVADSSVFSGTCNKKASKDIIIELHRNERAVSG